jgi:hypothetical protein
MASNGHHGIGDGTGVGIQAPHGPDITGDHPPMQDIENNIENMNLNEKQIFDYLLHPDDSYTADGVYWADLPVMQKIKFVSGYDGREVKRELGIIGRMIKKDPLSPISAYFRNMVLPGAGLGLEG